MLAVVVAVGFGGSREEEGGGRRIGDLPFGGGVGI